MSMSVSVSLQEIVGTRQFTMLVNYYGAHYGKPSSVSAPDAPDAPDAHAAQPTHTSH